MHPPHYIKGWVVYTYVCLPCQSINCTYNIPTRQINGIQTFSTTNVKHTAIQYQLIEVWLGVIKYVFTHNICNKNREQFTLN